MAQIIMRGSVAYYLVQRARIKYLIFCIFLFCPLRESNPGRLHSKEVCFPFQHASQHHRIIFIASKIVRATFDRLTLALELTDKRHHTCISASLSCTQKVFRKLNH